MSTSNPQPDPNPLPAPAGDLERRPKPVWAVRVQLLVYVLIVLAVLVVVNRLVVVHDHSWDLTKSQRNSLSPESAQIVRQLRQPLRMIYFDRSDSFGHARNFLQRYARLSNQVKLSYIDPDKQPQSARKYKIQTYGTLVLAYAGRTHNVATLTESKVTNALVRLLKGAKKIAYFTLGDGELSPKNSGRQGYSETEKSLESENYAVKTLILDQTPRVPDDCSVLVIAGPSHPWVQPEVQAVADYLARGGRVLFLLNFQDQGPLISYISKNLGVKLTPDVVVDTSGIGRAFGASPLMPIAAQYDPHAITRPMQDVATLFPMTRTVEAAPAGNGSNAVVSPLVETSSASFAVTDLKGLASGSFNPATSRKGPLTLGVAGSMPATAPKPLHSQARFVVYGTPFFAANAYLGFSGNRDLFLNSMNWLVGQAKFIAIRPQPAANTPLNLPARTMRIIMWLVMAALPLAFVLAGVAVWWRRRRA